MIHINQVVQPFLCLKVIEPVLYDPSFLECSDRARLLSLRLNGSKRAKKNTDAGDFWQKVHSNDSKSAPFVLLAEMTGFEPATASR